MKLIETSVQTLNQLRKIACSFEEERLTKKYSMLHGSTIGQHLRHVIEFYTCLLNTEGQLFCYDKRERKLELETNLNAIDRELMYIIKKIEKIQEDRELISLMSFGEDSHEPSTFTTSLYRELAYCLEHTIHHSAIIKIAIKEHAADIELPENFGVAFSTLQNHKACAQ